MAENLSRRASRAEDTEALRERAVDIAEELIREGGVEQVKARILALRLGVSVGTIYNLFGQIDEVYLRANARAYDALYETVTSAREAAKKRGDDAMGQMLALSSAYLDFVTEHLDQWSAILAYNRMTKRRAPQWYNDKERALYGVIENTIENLPGAGDAKNRHITSRALWAAVHGIVTVSISRQALISSKEDVWQQIELVVRSVAIQLEKPDE